MPTTRRKRHRPRPDRRRVSVDIDVTRGLRVQGEVGVDGRSTIGLGTEWEY
jgi:translocation and assembly module TamB